MEEPFELRIEDMRTREELEYFWKIQEWAQSDPVGANALAEHVVWLQRKRERQQATVAELERMWGRS